MIIAGFLAAAAVTAGCSKEEAALAAAATAIERQYVVAADAARIAKDLRTRVQAGAYRDVCGDPAAFLARVNRELDAHDGHFHFEQLKPAAGAEEDWMMAWRSGGRTANAGVREVRVLEGNVGYLRLSSFYPWDMAAPKLRSAFALLADTDAVILDLRQNGGGDADTAGQIVKAFLAADVKAVQDVERRSGRAEDPLPPADLPPMPTGRPLAVLLDRRAASASEFVAYSLRAAGRAVVVGDRSAGAAHIAGEPVRLPGGYAVTIPDARPINRVTGANWEGQGVKPDVPGGDDPVFVARQRLAAAPAER